MSGVGSGLAAQIGIVKESVVNTPVAVTAFNPFLSETLQARPNFAQDMGLAAGAFVPLAGRRILTSLDGGGDVTFNLASKGAGRWMQACMGSTPSATQISTSGVYAQIHNIGSPDGASYTIQKGMPEIGGTVDPLTFSGSKVTAWELSCAPNGLLQLKVTVDSMNVQPTGAGALGLQTASYPATSNWGFNNVTVQTFSAYTTVSGQLTPTTPASIGIVRNISLKGGQPKKTDRWQAGSVTKAEALINDWQIPTGQLDIDYASTALYADFVGNTSIGLAITATGPIIGTSGTNTALIQFVMPAVYLEQGSTPQAAGPDVITVSYPFSVLSDGTNSMQCVIQSTDAAV